MAEKVPICSCKNPNFLYSALLQRHLTFTNQRLQYNAHELLHVIKDSKEMISTEPTLLEIPLPCVIVGDIHGHYYDLHRAFGMIERQNMYRAGVVSHRYLFLGDYVDRGSFSLECMLILLLLKLAYPKLFFLLRGNHETATINRVYGFYQELRDRFCEHDALSLWTAFNDLFAYFPLAAIVDGRMLCMHGGIGPSLNSLDDIRNIKRPLENPILNPLACDLLWADPMMNLKGFAPNTSRGTSVFFGEDAVVNICAKLKIDLIVRAHQMILNGYAFFCKRKLITVFSASSYNYEMNNKGAVLKIDRNGRIMFLLLNPVTMNNNYGTRCSRPPPPPPPPCSIM